MAYIPDLAKEMNRTEGMVIRMLKNRGYLKENGAPRKATVDAGLMREDGFIYKKGFELFVEELGYKEPVKKVKDNQQEGQNLDSLEDYCTKYADKQAQLFESQGAKSQKYFYDKYSELEKEDLEEKLELANDEREAIIHDGIHDFSSESKLYELENKIIVVKKLLNSKQEPSSEKPPIFQKWWEKSLSDAHHMTVDAGYDSTE